MRRAEAGVMELQVDSAGDVVLIEYKNHRGEVAERRIRPERIWFGETEWHPEPQWLMEAFDFDRMATRSFALRDVVRFDAASAHVPH